jgi:phage terminase large subunit-like protein
VADRVADRPDLRLEAPDGTRVIRTAWIEIPRKNGKSTIASGLALIVLLAADGEQGAEVYSAAGSKEQARIVFEEAKKMAQATPALRSRVRTPSDAIVSPDGRRVPGALQRRRSRSTG